MAKSRLLVKVRGNGKAFAKTAAAAFGASAVEIEPILEMPARKADAALGLAAAPKATWLRVGLDAAEDNPWDHAHGMLGPGAGFALGGGDGIEAVEPDIEQTWPPYVEPIGPTDHALAAAADICAFVDQDTNGGKAARPGEMGWNFDDAFSELAKARARFGSDLDAKLGRIVIAHLDTGYDPAHVTRPARLRTDLQRNFVRGDGAPDDATDQTPPGMTFIRNRGHGTATLALLAGNRLKGDSPHWPGFTDFLGGAPLAQVIPVRIADWVVRFSVGTMVQGFDYARRKGAHVLSMSMGGVSSRALVDAINLAYEAGMVLVTAAGNNFAARPMPRTIVFPARYRRVLAACGVMADGRAYADLDPGTMQGSHGPPSKMPTALGAYTPNVPWAQIDCGKVVDMDGAGTSAATPQIAAAAALWLAEHFDAVSQYPKPWMRVEAVRRALFETAAKTTARMGAAKTFETIGQGVLKADAALSFAPPAHNSLTMLPEAKASWSWLDMLTGSGVSLAPGAPLSEPRAAMLRLELTQMAQQVPEVEAAIADPSLPSEEISGVARRRYLEAALDHGNPSRPLRQVLESLLERSAGGGGTTGGSEQRRPIVRKQKQPPPPRRRLRIYALDPSIAKSLDSVSVNETTLAIPWDRGLEPGPVGEYLEVIDVDPASDRIYDPVDLNDPELIAQDGWPPSEGNPAFHQQMVYAVGMTTIGHFEKALGRKALWAPRYAPADRNGKRKGHDVPRLRIYPHALRAGNAYYSPDKKALLFGYFSAASTAADATAPGSMVFTCLSSDIIAHEMSHALLDGLHRRFQEVSNPDVPAFHEAFADIVALFQHFTMKDLVSYEIGRAHGTLSAARLLGGLARQFGEGAGIGGPLRDYLGAEIAGLDYATTMEVHARGSILVAAVYDAFIRIVERRSADLIRIATGGTGILPDGALHPDLVERLSSEACRAAEQVLHICIRALDYCPAVDITFGEYLRAIITADRDLVPDDPLNYRVAFMEAFRRRGLLPRGVRTVSEESLAWGTQENPTPEWLPKILEGLDLGWDINLDRATIAKLNEKNRWTVWRRLKSELKKAFAKDSDAYRQLGLLAQVPLYHSDGTVAREAGEGETTFEVFGVRPARRIGPDGSMRTEVIVTILQRQPVAYDGKDTAKGFFWFRGGATLIVDATPGKEAVRYSIVKNSDSTTRRDRQRQTAADSFLSPLRALYFGDATGEPFAMMHADREG